MIEQHNNSTIFKSVLSDNTNVIDFSYIGMYGTEEQVVTLTESDNGFLLGDAIYYDYKTNHYRRALAVNQIMSEVIGVVSKIIDKDSFELTLKGSIILSRYSSIPVNTPLYLSQNISGKLVQDEPTAVSKLIGTKTYDGINVNIQRGYFVGCGPLVQIQTHDNLIFNAEDKAFYTYDNQTDNTNYYPTGSLRYYTNQEIQDIITRIKNDIY